MAKYYISDTHFGHKNVLKFDNRPFGSIEEMEEIMIMNWNAVVRPEDDVYILGDFCYRAEKGAEYYLKRLNGHKHLIIGNHDKKLLKDEEAMKEFETVDKMTYVKDGDRLAVLCHFPLQEWNQYYRGAYHIYGHVHAKKDRMYEYILTEDRALNAGCMINNYMPVTFDQLIKNNAKFRADNEWFRAQYGDHRGPMQLDSGRWIAPVKWLDEEEYMEHGDIHWVFSEHFQTALMYHYRTEAFDDVDHDHTFESVMWVANEYPDSFEIPEEYLHEYSQQELDYLKKIVEKRKADLQTAPEAGGEENV